MDNYTFCATCLNWSVEEFENELYKTGWCHTCKRPKHENYDYKKQYCCKNSRIVYVKRELSNGSCHHKIGCLNCKQTFGGSIKKTAIPKNAAIYNVPLKKYEEYEIWRNALRDKITAFISDKFEQLKIDYRKNYEDYLNSQTWKLKRLKILQRDKFVCQECFTERANNVHHITYANLGDEKDYELVSLCQSCHDKIHNK